MNLIIPMAGWGSRLRPHTTTIPKPMMPIAGKPITERLVYDIAACANEKIENIVFIIRQDFGIQIEQTLRQVADMVQAKAHIVYQEEPLGTGHAVLCADTYLEGKVVVAFADTLFKADFTLDTDSEGIIWVNQVDNPTAFGVVKLDDKQNITAFVEKPQTYVSDLAIIGIYYFKEATLLRTELQYLIDNDIKEKGEYQLTNALDNMRIKGVSFKPGKVDQWMDCGNKNALLDTNKQILKLNTTESFVSDKATYKNAVIVPPCYIGEGACIENAVIGPYVSIGKQTIIKNSVLKNTVVQSESYIENKVLENAMIGNKATIKGQLEDISVGDYTKIE